MQYVGARYVPKFMGLYDATQAYEALCVVDNGMGTSYITKVPTPAGTPLTDTDYYAVYGASSGAIINLQNQIGDLNDLTTSDQDSLVDAVNEVDADIQTLTNKVDGCILVIGNSYVQRDVTLKLQDYMGSSYRKTYGGSGFVARSDNTTTFIDLLNACVSDASIDKDKVTDILFVSAMGDTWGITAQGASTYKSALDTALGSINAIVSANFPNCRRTMVTLAECRNAVYFSNDRYDALFIAHRFFKELCVKNDLEYLGWTGWNAMFSGSSNFEIDNYHPTANGASLIGQNILNAYLGCLEYSTLTSSYNCDFNLTSAGTVAVQVYINPNHETIICRVANITAGAQVIAVGDELINLKQIPIPPIAPLDQTNVYLQSDFNTLGGSNDLTRVTCTFENNSNGIGILKLSNVTDGSNIGSSQGILPAFCNLGFDL